MDDGNVFTKCLKVFSQELLWIVFRHLSKSYDVVRTHYPGLSNDLPVTTLAMHCIAMATYTRVVEIHRAWGCNTTSITKVIELSCVWARSIVQGFCKQVTAF